MLPTVLLLPMAGCTIQRGNLDFANPWFDLHCGPITLIAFRSSTVLHGASRWDDVSHALATVLCACYLYHRAGCGALVCCKVEETCVKALTSGLEWTRDGVPCLHFHVLGPAPLRPGVRRKGVTCSPPFGDSSRAGGGARPSDSAPWQPSEPPIPTGSLSRIGRYRQRPPLMAA